MARPETTTHVHLNIPDSTMIRLQPHFAYGQRQALGEVMYEAVAQAAEADPNVIHDLITGRKKLRVGRA